MSLDLTANIDANTTGFERSIENAINATRRYESSLNSLEADMMALEKSMDDHANQALARQHDALDKTGKAFFTFGAAVAVGLGLAVNEAIKWESAWAGVTKTTSGSAAEMAKLEDDLRSLAMVLPATHEEIAGVAEAAGQLGVAREDIAAFTKTAIDLGETTNLAAEEAATAIAQMMNVMQSAPDVIDEIGSTLVALGNDGASTEAQILSMAQRLTGAVKLVGGSEADVLGLASAMANLGIQSELGGGAMSRSILNIYDIVESGGDKLDTFARFSGTSAEEFARAWSEDPVRALDLFIQGMARSKDEGRNLIDELEKMGFKGTQNMQVLLRLAGAGGELTDALDLSSKAWEDNNALVAEAEKRYETTEAKISMARNQMRDAAIDIGGVLLPVLASMVDVGGDLMRTWSDLPEPLRDVFVVLGLITGAVALFGGAAMIAVPKVAAFKIVVDGLSAGALKTTGTRLMGLAGVLAGPWGIALGAGITALGIFAAKHGDAAREVDALKATLDDQTGALSDNSTEWAIKKLSDEGVLDTARQLGLDLGMVTDAALGNTDAIAALNIELDRLAAADPGEIVSAKGQRSLSETEEGVKEINDALGGTNDVLDDARTQWELENDAKVGSKAASEGAAEGQKGLNVVMEEGADLTGELVEEIQTLGEVLDDLSGAYLGNRAAGRNVRDSLREIRKATREYIKENEGLDGAFKPGTKSGDEFSAMLDGLAGDLQAQIDATEAVSGSYEETRRVWRESRDTLRQVAEDMGMSEDAAKKYVRQLLGTPALIKTHFEVETQAADSDVRALNAQLDNIDRNIVIGVSVHHSGGGDLPYLSGGVPTPAPRGNGPDLPPRSGRVGAWSAAGQQMGTRTPRQLVGAGGGASNAGLSFKGRSDELLEQIHGALVDSQDTIGRGIAREAGRGWSEQSRRTRATGLGGRPS